MFFLRHLNAFRIYTILLLITSLITIHGIVEFPIFNLIAYLFAHILIIYIGIYHFKKIIYLIFFICGAIFDIFLIEFGPHLITFMFLALLFNNIQRFLVLLSSIKLFILIILILFFSLVCEMLISLFLYNNIFESTFLLKNLLISLLISFPTLYFFSKIDRFE